jgi:PAS domain S-box-containing protein
MFSLLYVDDEPGLLEICQIFLEKTGDFEVMTVESGAEALANLARADFDAVVSDYQMPGMNGIDLLKTVRKTDPDIPFILFTGRGREEVVIEAINNGADFYLQKGGDPQSQFAELAHKLRQAIGRRKAEKALSDSEKRLADIINFLPDATFAIDTEGNVIAWNRAIEEMTGIPAPEIIGKGDHEYAIPFYGSRRPILIDLIFEPDESVDHYYSHIHREGTILSAETDLPHPKGTRITVIAKASPLYDRNGNITGAIESIRDISERKKAEEELRALYDQLTSSEEELRESEAKYRTLFEKSRDAVLIIDNNVFIDCNASALTMLGLHSKDEFTHLHPSEISPAQQPDGRDSFEKAEEMMSIALRDGSNRFEWVHRRANGDLFWAEVSLTAIPIGGRPIIHTVWRDVTERKKAEDELHAAYEQITASEEELRSQLEELVRVQEDRAKSEENFRILVENAPDAIYIQTNNQFRYLNNAALSLMGASSSEQLLGKDVLDRIHPDFHERIRGRIKSLTVDLLPVDLLDEIYLKLDGTPVDVEVSAVPFLYEGEHGALMMVRDISVRKRAAEDLLAANEQLAASGEELQAQYNELAINEKRIRESEERYRTVVEHAPAGMHFYELNPEGILIFKGANPSADAILKIRHADYVGKPILEVFPGLADTEVPNRYREAAASGTPWQTDQVFYEKGKIQGAFSVSAFQIQPGSMVSMFIDITERKRAENELKVAYEKVAATEEELRSQYNELVLNENQLRSSEARLRYMLGFYDLAEGEEQQLKDSAVEGAGMVTESPLGYLAFLNEDESELTMYAWSKSAMRECALVEKPIIYKTEKTGLWGEPVRQRRPVITNDYAAPDSLKKGYPDGHPQIVRHMGVPVIENGHVVLVAGVANKATDYTDEDVRNLLVLMQGLWQVIRRKLTESALIENEARFRSIFDNSPYPIVINNRKTRKYIAVNTAFLTENGYTMEDVIGKDSLEIGFISPEDQTTIVDLLQTNNRVDRLPITVRNRGGAESHLLISALPVMFHNVPAILSMTADITELEHTREELRARYDDLVVSKNELRARKQQMEEIASTIPGVVYQYYVRPDGSGGFSYINLRSGREIFGADDSVTDFLAWFTEHVHPGDRDRFTGSVNAVLVELKPWNFEGRFIKPSGEEIWFSAASCPVEHETEWVFTGIIVDITARKQDEARLRAAYEQISASEEKLREQYESLSKSGQEIKEREEKYRLLVELTGTGYVIIDDNGLVLDANPEYVRMTGFSDRTDVVGRNVLDWTYAADHDKNAAAVQQCLGDGKIYDLEVSYQDRAGRITPVEINAAVVHEGGRVQIIALTRDISGRKATERALRTSEVKYRTLVENSHDIIYTLDKNGIFTFISPSVTPLMGYQPSDMIGKSYISFVHKEDIALCEDYLGQALAKTELKSDLEYRIIHADGSIRVQMSNISPVLDEDGSVLFVVGTARDISDLKQSELAIREASKKLSLLNSITRHDVANQLTTLLGYTQLAMMTKPDPAINDFLTKIETSAKVIQRQIEFTRAYQELGVSAPTWQRIGDLVTGAMQKAIPVTCTCPGYEVYADPMLLKVFFNLFDNAIRHGEHATAITVRCEIVSGELVIFVEDNGVGIPLDAKAKLFRKGYGKNTGFGLFLAREILAITGISIHETGFYGKGARFEIAVPKGIFRPAA